MTSDPTNTVRSGQGFFRLSLVAIRLPEQFDPCVTFDPVDALRSGQGSSDKFGTHGAVLKQIDRFFEQCTPGCYYNVSST